MLYSDSRYRLSEWLVDEDTKVAFLSARPRVLFRQLNEIYVHNIIDGDTLHSLAGQYYGRDGVQFWWAIGDFQQPSIDDPTVTLSAGSTILIPPYQYILDMVSGITNDELVYL
jgi:hypothetical protein